MRRKLITTTATVVAAATLAVPGLAAASPAQASAVAAEAAAEAAPAADLQSGPVTLNIDYQVQETGYWCGPAATRIALSARGIFLSQGDLAGRLGTHEGGTDHIGQVTNVLASQVGWYETKEIPNDPPTPQQKELLWNDIVLDIDNNFPVVANIVAPPGNQPPGYPPDQTIYHYFTVTGYDPDNRSVLIADPASFSGNQIYWLSFDQLASLIPPKGYSA